MYIKQCNIPEGNITFGQMPEVIIIISNTIRVRYHVKIYFFMQKVIAEISTPDFTKKTKIYNLQLLNDIWNIAA